MVGLFIIILNHYRNYSYNYNRYFLIDAVVMLYYVYYGNTDAYKKNNKTYWDNNMFAVKIFTDNNEGNVNDKAAIAIKGNREGKSSQEI